MEWDPIVLFMSGGQLTTLIFFHFHQSPHHSFTVKIHDYIHNVYHYIILLNIPILSPHILNPNPFQTPPSIINANAMHVCMWNMYGCMFTIHHHQKAFWFYKKWEGGSNFFFFLRVNSWVRKWGPYSWLTFLFFLLS